MDDITDKAPFELSDEDRRLLSLRRWSGATAERLVEVFESSGLSVDDFAVLGGADPQRFERLVKRSRGQMGADRGFAAVDIQAGGGPIVVHVGWAAIAVAPGFDPVLLRTVVAALAC